MCSIFNFNEEDLFKKIKYFNNSQLIELSKQIKELIIDKCSIYGGHLSSNLGVINLTISLFKNFDFDKDKIVFDIGHYCYTYKILTGRPLTNLRRSNGIDGFQKITESKYDFYDAGHSSTSLSAALAFAKVRDLKHEDYHVLAFVGDGAVANGLCFEAINNLIFNKTKIIIVLNDNEMSISPTTGGVAAILKGIKKNPFVSIKFKDANFEYIGPIDGDDFSALKKAFDRAKASKRSVIVHVKTLKGEGYKYSEEDKTGEFHYVNPFDKETGKIKNAFPNNRVSFSKLFADELNKELENNEKALAVCPATTVGSCISEIFKKYPDRCFDLGISEEHSAIFSSALSLNDDYHPYLFMYSTFLQRAYDEIIHDIARIGKGVTMLIDRAGLIGYDGETHQGIYDDAFFFSIPNVILSMPKDKNDAIGLFNIAKNYNKPFAIRYPAAYLDKNLNNNKEISFGSWYDLKTEDSKDIIVSFGPHIDDLYIELKDEKVTIRNAIFLKGYNDEEIDKLLGYEKIFIYDPYGVETGFASNVLLNLQKKRYKGEVFIKAIPLSYIQKGTIEEQEKWCEVDVESFLKFYEENK